MLDSDLHPAGLQIVPEVVDLDELAVVAYHLLSLQVPSAGLPPVAEELGDGRVQKCRVGEDKVLLLAPKGFGGLLVDGAESLPKGFNYSAGVGLGLVLSQAAASVEG